jgi:hypothetical protein
MGEHRHYGAFREMSDCYFRAFDAGEENAIEQMIDFYGGAGTFAGWPQRVRDYAVATTAVNILDWRTAYGFLPTFRRPCVNRRSRLSSCGVEKSSGDPAHQRTPGQVHGRQDRHDLASGSFHDLDPSEETAHVLAQHRDGARREKAGYGSWCTCALRDLHLTYARTNPEASMRAVLCTAFEGIKSLSVGETSEPHPSTRRSP